MLGVLFYSYYLIVFHPAISTRCLISRKLALTYYYDVLG